MLTLYASSFECDRIGLAPRSAKMTVAFVGPSARRKPGSANGSSFVSDPYGRVLVQAPRERPAVLVADLDLDQRRDWLALFPMLATRRPDTYGSLTESM